MVGNGSTYFTCDYFNAVLLGGIAMTMIIHTALLMMVVMFYLILSSRWYI